MAGRTKGNLSIIRLKILANYLSLSTPKTPKVQDKYEANSINFYLKKILKGAPIKHTIKALLANTLNI